VYDIGPQPYSTYVYTARRGSCRQRVLETMHGIIIAPLKH
jgi:hypothetical protein